MIIEEETYLEHYGILRKSGRYPWNSGGNPAQRGKMFFNHLEDLRAQGLTDPQIAKGWEMSSTQLRAVTSMANNAIKQADVDMAQRLHDKGMSNIEVGKKMGRNESSVRALLEPGALDKINNLNSIVSMLKEEVGTSNYVDVGTGVEQYVGVNRSKLELALHILRSEGYAIEIVDLVQSSWF